jgi:hypothetical protein
MARGERHRHLEMAIDMVGARYMHASIWLGHDGIYPLGHLEMAISSEQLGAGG